MQQVADDVVADAQRARVEKAAEADDQPADAPATTSSGSAASRTASSTRVEQAGQQRRTATRRRRRRRSTGEQPPPWQRQDAGDRETAARRRTAAAASDRRDDGGRHHRNEAARLPLEQQQLDRQQHRRDGRAEYAVMPAAAPATSSVFRSAALRWKNCANSEPSAPPVMMIGPSAPNGPPVPMEMADDSGLSIATLASCGSGRSGSPRWPRECRGREFSRSRSAPSGRQQRCPPLGSRCSKAADAFPRTRPAARTGAGNTRDW